MKRLLWALLLALFLCGCTSGAPVRSSISFTSLDTVVELTVYGRSERFNRKILAGAQELCESYDSIFSRTSPGSEISAFNRSQAGAPLGRETLELIHIALDYGARSGQVFDITIGPLSSLWNFHEGQTRVPTPHELEEALTHVGSGFLYFHDDGSLGKSDPAVQLDLGGIAKGYIADRLGDYFKTQGIENALINLGGNVLALGQKPGGEPWVVGVESPFSQEGALAATLPVTDRSLVTSGVSQRSFTDPQTGVLHHHILDPQTGWPVRNGLASVTIITETSIDAEALSTICFLLGLQDGMALLESTPGAEGIFIKEDGSIAVTSTLKNGYTVNWEGVAPQ